MALEFTIRVMLFMGHRLLNYHNDVADMEDALSALIRIKVEGGPASYSYKNYNQYSRFVF